VAHPSLWLGCPTPGEGKESWCSGVLHVEETSRVVIVEKDDGGERTRAPTEDEGEGGVERGESMPGEARALR
jgi:hypothetical protein